MILNVPTNNLMSLMTDQLKCANQYYTEKIEIVKVDEGSAWEHQLFSYLPHTQGRYVHYICTCV